MTLKRKYNNSLKRTDQTSKKLIVDVTKLQDKPKRGNEKNFSFYSHLLNTWPVIIQFEILILNYFSTTVMGKD